MDNEVFEKQDHIFGDTIIIIRYDYKQEQLEVVATGNESMGVFFMDGIDSTSVTYHNHKTGDVLMKIKITIEEHNKMVKESIDIVKEDSK